MARKEHCIYCASLGYLSVISAGAFSDATHLREVFCFCACMKIMIAISPSKNTKKKRRSFVSRVDFKKCRSLSLSVRPLIRLVAAQKFQFTVCLSV